MSSLAGGVEVRRGRRRLLIPSTGTVVVAVEVVY